MRAPLAALASAVAAGCASPAPPPVEAGSCVGTSVDSARAARLAVDAFGRVDPSIPLRVLEMRRERCAWVVTPGSDLPMRGGGGVVRVDSAGGAAVVARHQ